MKCRNSIKEPLILACVVGLMGMSAFNATAQTIDAPSAHLVHASAMQAPAGDAGEGDPAVEATAGEVATAGDEGPAADSLCPRQTGSKIRSRTCGHARGRTHDRSALDATGRKDVGTQVQTLDAGAHVVNRLNDGY